MGAKFTCQCSKTSEEAVLVMKENGDFIKFGKGITAKEVERSHPIHKILQCGSDRTVLPGTVELQTNRLYFLVPKEHAVSRDVYSKFVEVAKLKGGLPRRESKEDEVWSDSSKVNARPIAVGQFFLFEGSEMKKAHWKPRLETIPENARPHVSVYVVDSLPETRND